MVITKCQSNIEKRRFTSLNQTSVKNEKPVQEEGNCLTRQYRVRFDYFLTYLSSQITVSYLVISFS